MQQVQVRIHTHTHTPVSSEAIDAIACWRRALIGVTNAPTRFCQIEGCVISSEGPSGRDATIFIINEKWMDRQRSRIITGAVGILITKRGHLHPHSAKQGKHTLCSAVEGISSGKRVWANTWMDIRSPVALRWLRLGTYSSFSWRLEHRFGLNYCPIHHHSSSP